MAIARAFARLTGYHATFCSCNTVFRQSAAADDGWCGNCPKCRFVGLMLAPFVEPAALTAIFGRDMFTDPGQCPVSALISDEDNPSSASASGASLPRRSGSSPTSPSGRTPQW